MNDRDRPRERQEPRYDLGDVVWTFQAKRYELSGRVRRHMRRKGWSYADLERCVLGLESTDFHKSQEHRGRPGVWLDIYRPWICGTRRYVKFVRDDTGDGYLVLSFCEDGEAH